MKARRKGTNCPFKTVEKIQLKDSDILYDANVMEVEQDVITTHDTLSTDLKTFDQIDEGKHWQDLRERAAIAAMQGTITILSSSDRYAFRDIVVEGFSGDKKTYPNEIAEFAVACADALVEHLKEK